MESSHTRKTLFLGSLWASGHFIQAKTEEDYRELSQSSKSLLKAYWALVPTGDVRRLLPTRESV